MIAHAGPAATVAPAQVKVEASWQQESPTLGFSRAFSLGVPSLAIAYPLITRSIGILHLWITGRELRAATAAGAYFFAFLVCVFCVFAYGLSFDVKGRLGSIARILAVIGLVLNILFALRQGYA